MHPDPQKLDEIVRRVVEAVQPEEIILFGSAARGEMGPNSDIDLLVIKSGVHRGQTTSTIYRGMRGAGYPIDVVVAHREDIDQFGDSPALVFRDALRSGRVIYVN